MVRHHRIASGIALTFALAAAAPASAKPVLDPPASAHRSAPASTNLCSEVCSGGSYTATTDGIVLRRNPSAIGSAALAPSNPRSEVVSSGGYGTPAVVRIVAPSNGFDWGDAGIGAGGAVVLMLVIAGGTLGMTGARRHATRSAA